MGAANGRRAAAPGQRPWAARGARGPGAASASGSSSSCCRRPSQVPRGPAPCGEAVRVTGAIAIGNTIGKLARRRIVGSLGTEPRELHLRAEGSEELKQLCSGMPRRHISGVILQLSAGADGDIGLHSLDPRAGIAPKCQSLVLHEVWKFECSESLRLPGSITLAYLICTLLRIRARSCYLPI